MTLIRDIACEEVPVLLDGARAFFAEGRLSGVLKPQSFVEGWRQLLMSGMGVLIGAFEDREFLGAIGGSIFPDFPTGDLVAAEMFWFTMPGQRSSGLRLLKAFELRAGMRGAKRIVMVHLAHLNGEQMGRIYQRRGYELKEHIYIKNL